MTRLLKIGGGFLLLAAGVTMLALPGPGWLTVALGLAILATEYAWARSLLQRLKQAGGKLRTWSRGRRDRPASSDRSPARE